MQIVSQKLTLRYLISLSGFEAECTFRLKSNLR